MSASAGSLEAGVVLVPGAWFAPAAWSGVVASLRDLGVPASVARLHRGSLSADTAAVIEALDALANGPAIVCGHSYGGAVITGLPPERVAHLVYLAAVMPTEQETALGLAESEPSRLFELVRATDQPGVTVLDPTLAAAVMFDQSTPADAAAHAAALVPQEMSVGNECPRRAAWRSVPSTYIVCDDDLVLSPVLQRRLARRATQVVTWHSDHTPFLHRPEQIAGLLGALAEFGQSGTRLPSMINPAQTDSGQVPDDAEL